MRKVCSNLYRMPSFGVRVCMCVLGQGVRVAVECLFLGVQLVDASIHSTSIPFVPGTLPSSGPQSYKQDRPGLALREQRLSGQRQAVSKQIHRHLSVVQSIEIDG